MKFNWFRRQQREEELEHEIRHHLDAAMRDRIARGEAPDVARVNALREFGNVGLVKEVTREMWGWASLERLMQDLRFGVRMLLKQPGFTLVAVLTLALGIGANTAIFSVVQAVLLRPLPVPAPEQLLTFWHSAPAQGLPEMYLNDAQFAFYRDHSRMFAKLAAYENAAVALTGGRASEVLAGARVTFNYFDVLGQGPLHGRAFLPQEDQPGHDQVVILSHELWQQRYGGDLRMLGQSIQLDYQPKVVVGIMPPGFDFPHPAERADSKGLAQLWLPKALNPQDTGHNNLSTLGRLQAHATADAARREIAALLPDFAGRFNKTYSADTTTVMAPLERRITGEVRTPLLALLGAVGFVLLIACANLANLLLARVAARRRELAVRQCLGASGWRIARQLLTESLLPAGAGAVGGVLLATWGVAALKNLAAAQIPRLEFVRLDLTVLLFAAGITVFTGLLCSAAPVWRSTRISLQEAVKAGGRGSVGSHQRVNNAFVVAQLALSLMLLIGAALLLQSFRNLLAVNPGFQPQNVLMGNVSLPKNRYGTNAQINSFYDQWLAQVRSLPGVQAAELTRVAPFSGGGVGGPFTVEGHEPNPGEVAPDAWLRGVTPGYFAALGMPIKTGRAFQAQDTENSLPVAIVDEKLARRYWPHEDPTGKRLRIGNGAWLTIVGVVPSVKNRKLDEDTKPYVYRPATQSVSRSMALVVRTANDPAGLIPALRQQLARLDAELPLAEVRTMEQAMARTLVAKRLTNLLFTGFAALALLLALVGIYGVMALNVGSRISEFGLRQALGAQAADVLKLVIGQALKLTLLGVALGVAGALALTRLLNTLLFGVNPTDPPTFVGVVLLLALMALLACWIPARRATKVDPLIALRHD